MPPLMAVFLAAPMLGVLAGLIIIVLVQRGERA